MKRPTRIALPPWRAKKPSTRLQPPRGDAEPRPAADEERAAEAAAERRSSRGPRARRRAQATSSMSGSEASPWAATTPPRTIAVSPGAISPTNAPVSRNARPATSAYVHAPSVCERRVERALEVGHAHDAGGEQHERDRGGCARDEDRRARRPVALAGGHAGWGTRSKRAGRLVAPARDRALEAAERHQPGGSGQPDRHRAVGEHGDDRQVGARRRRPAARRPARRSPRRAPARCSRPGRRSRRARGPPGRAASRTR